MTWTTLITADDLAHEIDRCLVIDCHHDLTDPQAGQRAYEAAHIPGARFVRMDDQLSGAKNGRNGRHPMPSREAVRALLESLGLSDGMQLVVYDAAGGGMAGRLWWMARWVGHEAVAVLDGGLPAWRRAGFRRAACRAPPGRADPAHAARHPGGCRRDRTRRARARAAGDRRTGRGPLPR
jgi:thiosulfate/3-mercaptopyruvate sulfurtransferase